MDNLGPIVNENNNNNNENNDNGALFDNNNNSSSDGENNNDNNNGNNDNNDNNNNNNDNHGNNNNNIENNNNDDNNIENNNNNQQNQANNLENNNENNPNANENNNDNNDNNNNNNGNNNNNQLNQQDPIEQKIEQNKDDNHENENENEDSEKVNNKVNNKVKKKKNKNDKLDESIESADVILDHSSDSNDSENSDDEQTKKKNSDANSNPKNNNKKNKKKNSEKVNNNLNNSNRANSGPKRQSQNLEKNLQKDPENKNKNNKISSESSDEESSDKSDQEEENEYSANDNMNNDNNHNSVHENEDENNDLSKSELRNFFDNKYLKGNEAIECDYENKTITITVGQLKYVFNGSKGTITTRNKSDNSEAEAPIKDDDLKEIDLQSSENEAKIIINRKKQSPRYITIKNKQLIKDMNSFEKTEIETELFKPGIVYRFVDHYLKNYSKLSDVKLIYKLSNGKQSPHALNIKCTSGEKDENYPMFIYLIKQKGIWYFTENGVKKRIDEDKIVAKIGTKMVKFEIIDHDGRPIIYKLPISDKFIKLLKQTDKNFRANDNEYKYIEIDFNALCDVVEINNVPSIGDINYTGITITGVQKLLDDLYEFNTDNENTCIIYNANDKTFEYIENGKCVKTYDILSYENKVDKNKGSSLYLSNRGGEKPHLCFYISNKEMKSFFKKLCGESTESKLLIKGEKLTNALKDKCKEKKPNVITNFFKKPPKGIKYITGKEITIANEGENLVFSLDENGENKITIPIRDFLFGNLAAFTCQRKNEDCHITYYDDALVLEHKTDDPNSRSTIIIDFKQMLQEQNLDTEQYQGLNDMKSFLIRIKAAEKKQQEQEKEQLQQPDDNDYFFEVENDIISTIYNNGKNIRKAAAYMHLNDYINAYADQEMTEDEINFFIDIFGSLNDEGALVNIIENQIKANQQPNNKKVDFNKIFIALMCIAEPEQVQTFTDVFIEEYKTQNIRQEGDSNWPEMNALIAYGYITNDQNQEFNQSVTDYTDRAQQNNVNDIQNNAPEIPQIITDIVFCKKRKNINNSQIEKQNLNIFQTIGNGIGRGYKYLFGKK